MPLQATSGAASYDAFGGGVPVVPNYIEDVFSTWLYNGTGANQTITNNIDLSTKGGLVWIKPRTIPTGGGNHSLFDTVRGATKGLQSNTTDAQQTWSDSLTAFNTTGFTLGADGTSSQVNVPTCTYASWTFRKQPKFFDVVTWSGNSFAGARAIPHNLGVAPAVIIVKNLTNSTNWLYVQGSSYLRLNTTSASDINNLNGGYADVGAATSTSFDVYPYFGTSQVNETGSNYVAYLFASNAGGFGLTGTDNVISCGSFTTDGSAYANVNLGYEPQWVMCKRTDGVGNWQLNDNMRGMTTFGGQIAQLYPNLSNAEGSGTGGSHPTATGFESTGLGVSQTYIYIAIRRGPMKVPTDATKVFKPTATAVTTGTTVTTGFVTDLQMANYLSGGGANTVFTDRLRGISNTSAASRTLGSANTNAEINTIDYLYAADNTGWKQGSYSSGGNSVRYDFLRAPSFFDEVCYTGTGANRTVTHNLAAVPELMIVKNRVQTGGENWTVYTTATTATKAMYLNTTGQAVTASVFWNNTDPTSTVFSVGTAGNVNTNTETYVAYLFATCAGVSKVGSYTGNGTTQTINCGFGAGGARFVLIKRTDSTGDWYVYDTARGMTTLTDPYLLLNSTAAETATLGSVTTVSTGFAVNASILAAINTNGASYIFLSIA